MPSRTEYEVTVTAKENAELLAVQRTPPELKADEVAGRTLATVISAGTELAASYQKAGSVPGYAAVFEVEQVGGEVADLKPGDRVYVMGGHRSHQKFQRKSVLPVPKGLAPEIAVFARMMGVSMTTLVTTSARPPAKVAVTGLGLVGHLAAKVFHACGYDVVASDPVESRRKFAIESGIPNVLPSLPIEDPAWKRRVALVVECSGHEQAVLDGCRIARKGGEVACIGAPWARRSDISAHDLHWEVFHNYVTIRSGWEWELPHQETDFGRGSIFGNYAAALQWLAQGRVKVDGIFVKTSPREAQKAYQDLFHKRAERLAVVFDWTDCP